MGEPQTIDAPQATGNFDELAFDALAAVIDGSEAGTRAVEYDKNGNPILSDAVKAELLEETPEDPAKPEETLKEETKDEDPEETQEESKPDEPAAIDYDLEVPMADGDAPLTISAMKDEITELRRQHRAVETQAQEMARDRILVNELLANPGDITPERRQQFEQAQADYTRRELETVAQMFPHWQDKDAAAADQSAMRQFALSAGASEQDLSMLTRPWILNVLKRAADYSRREEAGKQKMVRQVKSQPKSQTKGSNPTAKPVNESRFSQFEGALSKGDFNALDSILR